MSGSVIILGSGGHAKVLIDILCLHNVHVSGFTDREIRPKGSSILGVPYIGADDTVMRDSFGTIEVVNGLGSTSGMNDRRRLFEQFKSRGFSFTSVVHPSAIIGLGVTLGEGVQLMAGAIIQPGSHIGDNSIVNTKASVDHDCKIGDHVHVAPGATLSGGVTVGPEVHIGTSAAIIQEVRVGKGSLVGAGAVVIDDVPAGACVLGVPARVVST